MCYLYIPASHLLEKSWLPTRESPEEEMPARETRFLRKCGSFRGTGSSSTNRARLADEKERVRLRFLPDKAKNYPGCLLETFVKKLFSFFSRWRNHQDTSLFPQWGVGVDGPWQNNPRGDLLRLLEVILCNVDNKRSRQSDENMSLHSSIII